MGQLGDVGAYQKPLPGITSAVDEKVAALEARIAELEAVIKRLIDKYFGTHL